MNVSKEIEPMFVSYHPMLFRIHRTVCNGRMRGRDQKQTTSATVGEPSTDLRVLDRNDAARQLPANSSVTMAMRGISRDVVDLGPAFWQPEQCSRLLSGSCGKGGRLREPSRAAGATVGANRRNFGDLAYA